MIEKGIFLRWKIIIRWLDGYQMKIEIGGISQYCKKYNRANNKYMRDYNSIKESNYLVYLDTNNLFAWAIFTI